MKQRKLLALGMATLMALSSTVMAFAADETAEPATGSVSGDGTLEGFVDKEVFTVTLPTTSTIDFKLDPQELLLATKSTAKLDGSALAAGYGSKILFVDGDNFTSKSADITVVNKSTFDVDVTIGAKLTGLSTDNYNIDVLDASADDFDFGDSTAITMAITPSTNKLTGTTPGTAVAGTATALTSAENGITLTETVAVSDDVDKAYEVTGTTGSYSYGLKADTSAVAFNTVTFNLSGTVNTAADWTNFSKATNAALGVEITYSVSKHSDSPVFTTGDAVGTIAYTTGSGDSALASITSIKLYRASTGASYDGYNKAGTSWAAANDDGSTITFASAFMSYYSSQETAVATITYVTNSGDEKTATVDVKCK